jgi:RNA polymerase sigma-70 factor (ECF subfamily)
MQGAAEVRAGFLRDQPQAVETVRGWIAAMVFGAGWGLEDPEGAIQEVTMRVMHLGRRGRIRDDTDFKSFVLTVARHECTDIYRRERLRTTVETRGAPMEQGSASGDNPHQRLEEREQRELLRFLFQELPQECRRLWRWLYKEGLSAAEVASRLGITAVNARVRAHRCLEKARSIRDGYLLGAGVPSGAGRHG